MSILILFASHFGQTRAIAERLAECLRARGHEIDLGDVRFAPRVLPPPEDYDVVVLGSRVELGSHAPELRDYIRQHRVSLAELPTAMFSVSMAATNPRGGTDPGGYMSTMFDELGWTPTRAIAFGGALPYRKYGHIRRFIMKRISRAAGHPTDTSRNHVFTDWERVERFAEDIAALVPHAQRVARM